MSDKVLITKAALLAPHYAINRVIDKRSHYGSMPTCAIARRTTSMIAGCCIVKTVAQLISDLGLYTVQRKQTTARAYTTMRAEQGRAYRALYPRPIIHRNFGSRAKSASKSDLWSSVGH